MILCPLCEAIFIRYEFALDEGYTHLAPRLRRAMRQHSKQDHPFRMLLDASMYFTSIEVYRSWMGETLNKPTCAAAWGVGEVNTWTPGG